MTSNVFPVKLMANSRLSDTVTGIAGQLHHGALERNWLEGWLSREKDRVCMPGKHECSPALGQATHFTGPWKGAGWRAGFLEGMAESVVVVQ